MKTNLSRTRFVFSSRDLFFLAGMRAVELLFFLAAAPLAWCITGPSIDYQPTNQVAVPGQLAAFSVTASGSGTLSYQWRKNGSSISGATSNALVFNAAQFTNAGTYSVVVSNLAAGVTSSNATLKVNLPFAGDVDPTFAPGASLNERVTAFAVQPDGKVIIVGAFTAVNGVPRGRIARLNADGTTDYSFMNGQSGADGYVYAVALQPDGKVLVGGQFSKISGTLRFDCARLNSDGSVDTTFGNTTGVNSAVTSLALQLDGKVLIGGIFSSVNGTIRSRIARLNSDGSTDTTFQNGMSGANGQVNAIVVQTNGSIVIGGAFTSVNGTNRNYVARLTSTGALDTTFLNGMTGLSGSTFGSTAVDAMVLQTNNVIIAGDFTSVNGTNRNCIARLNSDGSLDTTFLNGLSGTDSPVLSVALDSVSRVVIGGYFFQVNGSSRSRVARLNADGSVDNGFQSGMSGANNSVLGVAVQSDNKVLIGGFFTAVNGTTRRSCARLIVDGGGLDSGFANGNPGVNNVVRGIAEQTNGAVIVVGDLTAVNGTNRNYVARLNRDGSFDTSFLNGLTGPNALLYTTTVQPDGKILIGGFFTFVNGVSRGHVARLNYDGTLDTGFMNGLAGSDQVITSMLLQTNGNILIGGSFTTVNGTSRGRIARLNSDGTLDTSFLNGLTGANGSVDAIATQSDGKILIGGNFTTFNGTNHNRIARLNSDGTLDVSFQNGLTGANAAVSAIAVQPDGQILVGGGFSTMNGVSKSDLVRLNSADGTVEAAFPNSTFGPSSTVYSIAVLSSGKILLGGAFTYYNAITRGGFAQINADGSLDAVFGNNQVGANAYVHAVLVSSDKNNKLLVGGEFGGVNGQPAAGVARVYGSSPSPVVSAPVVTNGQFQLSFEHVPGTTNAVDATDSLFPINWIPLYTNLAPFNYVDPNAGTHPQRIYRIRALQ